MKIFYGVGVNVSRTEAMVFCIIGGSCKSLELSLKARSTQAIRIGYR